MTGRRGQLVLLAAVVVAVALVPMVFAYMQLGYHADVSAGGEYTAPAENADRVLSRTVHDAATTAERHPWNERDRTADEVRAALEPDLATLESARVERGTVYRVQYNDTAASAWTADACPTGPARQFGPCAADGGVVLQERSDETHVVAVAVDVHVVGERRTVRSTVVVRAVGGTER